jgi:hypothetical protein
VERPWKQDNHSIHRIQRARRALAMQKVEGSSPFSRFTKTPLMRGFSVGQA